MKVGLYHFVGGLTREFFPILNCPVLVNFFLRRWFEQLLVVVLDSISMRRIYLETLLSVLVAITGAHEAYAKPRKTSVVDTPSAVSLTRLRAADPVMLINRSVRGVELRHMNVDVQNVGQARAKDISVSAECGGRLLYPLKGPKNLQPGERSTYLLGSKRQLMGPPSIRIVTRCSNCRR